MWQYDHQRALEEFEFLPGCHLIDADDQFYYRLDVIKQLWKRDMCFLSP